MKRALLTVTVLAAAVVLTGCGKGEIGAGVGMGVSADSTRSSGTSTSQDASDSTRVSSSVERSGSMSLPASRVINLALGVSPAVRAAGLKEIRAGRAPLKVYANEPWPDGVTVDQALASAASWAAGSLEHWEVRPASLERGTADGHGTAAERAYVETLDTAACVTNAVGGEMARKLTTKAKVYPDQQAALEEARQLVKAITVRQLSSLFGTCVNDAEGRQRTLGQDTPQWYAGDYALQVGKGGVVVSANGSENWFGKGAYEGVTYELRFARSGSFTIEQGESSKTDASQDAKQSTTGSVSIGK